MRSLLIMAGLFLSVGSGVAQTYEELIEKSYDFVDKEEWAAAEESLKAAMRKEPANPLNYALLTNLGTIQRRQGKLEEALVSYTSALSGHPQNVTILENRASLYTELGEIDKALSDYNTLLIENPKDEETLYARGLIYVQQKKYLEAEDDFELILEVNDKSVRARLGYAILEKARGNYDDSERIFNYLISERPRDWSLYERRAELYYMMGKNTRAMADIEKVFAESEPTAFLYVLRGKIKLMRYEKERAASDFKKAETLGYDKTSIDELMKLTLQQD